MIAIHLLQNIIKTIRKFPYDDSSYIVFKPIDYSYCIGDLEFNIENDIKKITLNIDDCI